MSGGFQVLWLSFRRLQLHFDNVIEGQGWIGLGQHADLHPEFSLRVDGAAHDRTGLSNLIVQRFVNFYDAHRNPQMYDSYIYRICIILIAVKG